ncbi:MAG: sugar ABC transporter ATP-binding protein, partial [Rhizobiales bacterium]|nr:sugar ABC transporter ATP-binding protein [Hyphomicrobiales bacterium]
PRLEPRQPHPAARRADGVDLARRGRRAAGDDPPAARARRRRSLRLAQARGGVRDRRPRDGAARRTQCGADARAVRARYAQAGRTDDRSQPQRGRAAAAPARRRRPGPRGRWRLGCPVARAELLRARQGRDPRLVRARRRRPHGDGPDDHRCRSGARRHDPRQRTPRATVESASNIAVTTWDRLRSRLGLLDAKAETALADRFRAALGIRMVAPSQVAGNLSGGNQQKVSVAKWLAFEPEVLIFDEPTVGIDVATKFQLHELIHSLAEGGTSVIVISSDMPEIVRLADRILVFRANAIVGEFANSHDYAEMSPRIMHAIVGDRTRERADG